MAYEFSDIPQIEAAARILDRVCRGLQILAFSTLLGLAGWHGLAMVAP